MKWEYCLPLFLFPSLPIFTLPSPSLLFSLPFLPQTSSWMLCVSHCSGWTLGFRDERKVKVKVSQSCSTLCDPMDCTVHGILQTRIQEWVVFSFSRASSQPRDRTQVSRIAGGFFTSWSRREVLYILYYLLLVYVLKALLFWKHLVSTLKLLHTSQFILHFCISWNVAEHKKGSHS